MVNLIDLYRKIQYPDGYVILYNKRVLIPKYTEHIVQEQQLQERRNKWVLNVHTFLKRLLGWCNNNNFVKYYKRTLWLMYARRFSYNTQKTALIYLCCKKFILGYIKMCYFFHFAREWLKEQLQCKIQLFIGKATLSI